MAKNEASGEKQEVSTALGSSAVQWKCEINIEQQAITVGSSIPMVCEGEPVKFQAQKLQILLDEKQKYLLKVLKVNKISQTRADLIVTSYRAGQHQLKSFQLSDGDEFVDSGPLSFNVTSVLKKDPKPYGPFGPIGLQKPLWYWLGLGFVLLIIAIFIFFKARRYWQRKKIVEGLESHGTALSAYNQFNKDLRSWDRELTLNRQALSASEDDSALHRECLKGLEEIFRMYLVREFKVPALEWSDKNIIREVKKTEKKKIENSGEYLKKTLDEFRKMSIMEHNLSLADCLQMKQICRRCGDILYKEKG